MTDAIAPPERLVRLRRELAGPGHAWLLVRLALWCVCLRVLKFLVPLPDLVALVRRDPRAARRDPREEQRLVTLTRWASRATQWSSRGDCLERALVAYRYLTAANARPTLVVGLAEGEREARGHAWVTVDGMAVDDTTDTLDGFVPVVSFGPDGHPTP
ncbi:MAG: lasso peptide biosynthesis B2 protein [Acidobacteria bacterium]|nr:lasso peptide biosynthesis B2 protein [Acidobacteriota bacterium]